MTLSMFLTEIPMMSGTCEETARFRSRAGFREKRRSTTATSWPASAVADATYASPIGAAGATERDMFEFTSRARKRRLSRFRTHPGAPCRPMSVPGITSERDNAMFGRCRLPDADQPVRRSTRLAIADSEAAASLLRKGIPLLLDPFVVRLDLEGGVVGGDRLGFFSSSLVETGEQDA